MILFDAINDWSVYFVFGDDIFSSFQSHHFAVILSSRCLFSLFLVVIWRYDLQAFVSNSINRILHYGNDLRFDYFIVGCFHVPQTYNIFHIYDHKFASQWYHQIVPHLNVVFPCEPIFPKLYVHDIYLLTYTSIFVYTHILVHAHKYIHIRVRIYVLIDVFYAYYQHIYT